MLVYQWKDSGFVCKRTLVLFVKKQARELEECNIDILNQMGLEFYGFHDVYMQMCFVIKTSFPIYSNLTSCTYIYIYITTTHKH